MPRLTQTPRLRLLLLLLLLPLLGDRRCCSGVAAAAAAAVTAPLSCNAVWPLFEADGFPASDIPKEPISSKELKACGGISSGGEVCCSADMEIRLQARARDKHDRATKDTLQRLQNVLHARAVRFHDFFNNLLKTSKKSFHEMFKKTYGTVYEQNAYVFINLFGELEKYYAKGSVDLDDVMDTFFNTLYQKMFTVLNSQYKFDSKYLECVGHHMKEMRPFGDVPQKLGVQIKRSFVATRTFSQALQIAADVLKNMQQLRPSSECAVALTRMTACPACSGVSNGILACNNLCENVMKGCLAQHAALDADWNHFVEAIDKVAERLLGPFNIEMLVRPINLKISEAIMNFQESSSDVSQRVFTGCGRPVLGRRRRSAAFSHRGESERQALPIDLVESVDEDDDDEDAAERASSAAFLDKLVKEIKQRVRDSRQFWLYLPYKLCNDGNLVVPPSNTRDCWNGTHVDKYLYPLAANGEAQSLNPEVRATGPRAAVVREQLFALSSISSRLRSAFNGHDVDWEDAEDNWASGSGSGDGGASGPITDDEDGFAEEGSGYEAGPERSEPPVSEMPPAPLPPPRLDVVERVETGVSHGDDSGPPGGGDVDGGNAVPADAGAAAPRRMSLARALTSYLLPIVVVWFGGCLTDWL